VEKEEGKEGGGEKEEGWGRKGEKECGRKIERERRR